MIRIILIISLAIFSNILPAQKVNSFSVKQCVDYASKNSVPVKNALLDIKIQEQTNKEVTALAYPNISASGQLNYFPAVPVQSIPDFISPAVYGVLVQNGVKDGNGNPIGFPPGLGGLLPARFGTKFTMQGGIDASWILFDGQVFIGLKARNAVLEFARKQAEITEQTIKANITKIYYQLIVGQKQVGSIDAAISRLEKLLKDVQEIYKQGFTEKLDQEKVQVQLNNIQTEKLKILNQLEAGNASLKFLMGMPQKEILILTDTAIVEELKNDILNDGTVDYGARKEYQLITMAEKLGKLNIDRYKYSRYPQLVGFSTFSKNAQRNSFNFLNDGSWFSTGILGVKLNMPIFSGFAQQAKMQKAKIELQKTLNSKQQIEQLIDNDLAQANIKIKNAILTLDKQKANEALAQKVYKTTKTKYEQGLGSMQEIYDAETELRTAQSNYFAAIYDAIVAKVDYLVAIGKL